MTELIGLLTLLLTLGFIIGLIKPAIVLRWVEKPTRLKVFGYYLLASFIVAGIGSIFIDEKEVVEELIEEVKKDIDNSNLIETVETIEKVKNPSENSTIKQEWQSEIDNLNILNEKNKLISQQEAALQLKQQKEQLEREISSLTKGVDFSGYRGSVDLMQIELILFGTWSTIITDAENSENTEIKALSKNLKVMVQKVQKKEFPTLRKEYAKVVAKAMWVEDIEVTSSGYKHNNINFIGGIFITNKNKQEFQNQVHEILKMFRFSQSNYRFYKESDEYTRWEIFTGKDTDLVTFN